VGAPLLEVGARVFAQAVLLLVDALFGELLGELLRELLAGVAELRHELVGDLLLQLLDRLFPQLGDAVVELALHRPGVAALAGVALLHEPAAHLEHGRPREPRVLGDEDRPARARVEPARVLGVDRDGGEVRFTGAVGDVLPHPVVVEVRRAERLDEVERGGALVLEREVERAGPDRGRGAGGDGEEPGEEKHHGGAAGTPGGSREGHQDISTGCWGSGGRVRDASRTPG
jgi:hypothetical protein